MEKIVKKVPKYKQVEDGTKDIEIYVASDGREFIDKKMCKSWDDRIKYREKLNSITYVKSELWGEFPHTWYYPKDNNELEFLLKHFGYYDSDVYINDIETNKKDHPFPKPCEWIGCYTIDGGDYRDTTYIYTLDYVKDEIYKFLRKFSDVL